MTHKLKKIYEFLKTNKLLFISLLISVAILILNKKQTYLFWLGYLQHISITVILTIIVFLSLAWHFCLKIKSWIKNSHNKVDYIIKNNIPLKIILTIVVLLILATMFDDKQYKTISFFVFLITTSIIAILSFVLNDYLAIKSDIESEFREYVLHKRNKAHTYLLIWRSCLIVFLLIEIVTMTKHYESLITLSIDHLLISIPTITCSIILSITLFLGTYRAKKSFMFLDDLYGYIKLLTCDDLKNSEIGKLLYSKTESAITYSKKKYINKKSIEHILKILADKKD